MREISVEEYNMDTGDQREPSPNILALWKLIQSLLKSAPSSKKPLLTPPSMGRMGGESVPALKYPLQCLLYSADSVLNPSYLGSCIL